MFLYVLQKGSPPPQMLFQQYPKTQWVMLGHRRQISFKHMPTLLRLMQNRQSLVTHPFCMTATCLSREEEVQLTDHRIWFGYLWHCTLDRLFHNCDTAAGRMGICRHMAKWLLIAVAIVKIVQTSRLPPGTLEFSSLLPCVYMPRTLLFAFLSAFCWDSDYPPNTHSLLSSF